MTKEVLVKIKELQFAGEEDSDAVEIITAGNYYKKNGKHYILYDEVTEGSTDITKNVIKIRDDFMEVIRKGPASVHMVFEKNRKNVSYYDTPFGSLLVGIDAKNISVQETGQEINVQVQYGLEMNYEHVADCSITVNIKSKEVRNFKL